MLVGVPGANRVLVRVLRWWWWCWVLAAVLVGVLGSSRPAWVLLGVCGCLWGYWGTGSSAGVQEGC